MRAYIIAFMDDDPPSIFPAGKSDREYADGYYENPHLGANILFCRPR